MIRSSTDVVKGRAALREEMAGGDLGDARLNARRGRLIGVLEQHPDAGFPEACGSDSEVEALYRFLRNDRVSLEAVIEPHIVATGERCRALGEVLVIHDTTELSFAGETARAGLTRQSHRRQGFWMRAALAVSAEGLRTPLGLLSIVPVVRPARPEGKRKRPSQERFADPAKESRGWEAGVTAVRARVGAEVSAIHLMDREGDSYELFATMRQHGDRFVVRLNHDRRVVPEPNAPAADKLRAALLRTTSVCERQVTLSPRRVGDRSPKSCQQHPPREGRVATLRFAARRLVLQRPSMLGATQPETLPINVVYVWEVNAPPDDVPVEWRLITSEPIDTVEQVLQVVDWYRTRWLIEEFFKSLKTGCAYEKRQLESVDTLLVALALLAPIAWQLLLLRHLARELPDTPATAVLSPRQLHVLRGSTVGAKLPSTPTVAEALLAVARLGGHLRQNGAPGWLVLARGMQKLRCMEAGWAAAERAGVM